MNGIGEAPELQTNFDSMIDSISDRHIQNTLRAMRAENDRQYNLYRRALDDCVADIKTSFRAEIQSLAAVNAPPVPLSVNQFPEFIQASVQFESSGQSSPHQASSHDSSQSFSVASSMTDRADVVCQNGHIIALRCLFCTHYHFIEKSHYQHLDRLLTRLESGESYSGKCVVTDSHWLFQHYGVGQSKLDAVRLFIRQYLSHLHAGNDKNINPDRAAKLVTWLDSHHRS
jgi:hypothetical protein